METIKKDQSEIKNAISEINNILKGVNCGLDKAKYWISGLEDKMEKKHPRRAEKKEKN